MYSVAAKLKLLAHIPSEAPEMFPGPRKRNFPSVRELQHNEPMFI